MQFAAKHLAPYPDMALGSGRSHMNRYEIIYLLHQKNFCLGLISDLGISLRSFEKHYFCDLKDLLVCLTCLIMTQNDRVTKADILC